MIHTVFFCEFFDGSLNVVVMTEFAVDLKGIRRRSGSHWIVRREEVCDLVVQNVNGSLVPSVVWMAIPFSTSNVPKLTQYIVDGIPRVEGVDDALTGVDGASAFYPWWFWRRCRKLVERPAYFHDLCKLLDWNDRRGPCVSMFQQ